MHDDFKITVQKEKLVRRTVTRAEINANHPTSDSTRVIVGVVNAAQVSSSPFYQDVDIGVTILSTPNATEENLCEIAVYNGYTSDATVTVRTTSLVLYR